MNPPTTAGAVTLAICVISAVGCGQTAASVGPQQVSEEFEAAYNAKDAQRIASLYTEDGELMPPDSLILKGRAEIEALFKEKFKQNCSMEIRPVRSEIAGDRAFDTGRIAVTSTDSDGATQMVAGNYLAVFKRVGR